MKTQNTLNKNREVHELDFAISATLSIINGILLSSGIVPFDKQIFCFDAEVVESDDNNNEIAIAVTPCGWKKGADVIVLRANFHNNGPWEIYKGNLILQTITTFNMHFKCVQMGQPFIEITHHTGETEKLKKGLEKIANFTKNLSSCI